MKSFRSRLYSTNEYKGRLSIWWFSTESRQKLSRQIFQLYVPYPFLLFLQLCGKETRKQTFRSLLEETAWESFCTISTVKWELIAKDIQIWPHFLSDLRKVLIGLHSSLFYEINSINVLLHLKIWRRSVLETGVAKFRYCYGKCD